MDYFVFDLQLFAGEVTVDLSTLKNTLKTATKYLVNGEWQDTAPEEPATAVATLKDGVLNVTAAVAEEVVLTGVETADLAGVQVVRSTEGKLTVGEDGSIVKAKSLQFTAKGIVAANEAVTFTTAGAINVVAEKTFAVYSSMADTLPTTYKVSEAAEEKVTISVSGDYVGAYTGVSATGATITLNDAGKMGTVTSDPAATLAAYGTATLALDGADVTTLSTAVTKYYAITLNNNGALAIGDAAAEPDNSALGWYKVTYNPNNGLNAKVTVELVASDGQTAAQDLAGNVVIDATKVDKLNNIAVTAITVADDLSAGKVSVTGVPATADVTIAGTKYQDDVNSTAAGVTYVPTFAVDSSAVPTITLSKAGKPTTGDSATYYYVIKTASAGETSHGKKNCTITATPVTELTGDNAGKAAFKVTVTKTGVYTVEFQAADDTSKGPQDLNASGWQNITINAAGLIKNDTLTIKTQKTGTGDDVTQDNYTVNNAAIGVKVTKESTDGDNSVLTVNRASGTVVATTIKYDDGAEGGDTAITMPADAKTEYWKVTKDAEASSDGNPTITIAKQDDTTAPTGNVSYFAVTKDATGNVTVTYNNGGNISLTELKDANGAAVKVALAKGDLAAGNTLTISDANAKVDYQVDALPVGVKVVGNDSSDVIKRAEGTVYNNKTVLSLSGLTAGTPVYYTVTGGTVETDTGMIPVTATKYTGTGAPAATANYFTVSVNETGAYSVTYHVGTGEGSSPINLASDNTQGKTTVDAKGVTTGTIALSTKETISEVATNVVNDYAVINVVNGGLGNDSITKDGSSITDGASVTYEGPVYVLAAGAAQLALTPGTTTRYELTKTKNVRGIITYNIEAGVTSAADAAKSYLEVSYDSDKKTATISFKEGTEGAVTYKEFAGNISTAVKVDGLKLGADATTLVLTEDSSENGSINYDVTNLPKNVTTITNATKDKDTIAYQQTYKFADKGNKLALTADDGITYYEVTATGGDAATYGVNTCSIATEALKPTGDDEAAKEASIASKNYFKVEKKDGKVTITYHQAKATETVKEPKILALSSDMEVDVNPSAAGKVDIICGASTGDDADLIYNVKGLSKGQTAKAGTGTSDKVNVEYNVSYEFDSTNGKITLSKDDALAGKTVYYKVVRTDGATTGEEALATDAQGVVKFSLEKCTETQAKEAAAYFMVKYSSPYQVNVTYVNPTGANYDLTVDGVPQVVVDADGLATGTKIDTINVADTTGGDYNKVNYALTNVPAGVSVIDTNNENNALGEGDTVSYKNIAVLADNSVINLGTAAETYYVVTAGTTNNGVTTCTVDASGTKDKPADTANYFVATKGSDGKKYEITYHMANGTGYAFSDTAKNSLNINAAGVTVAPDTTTNTGTSTTGAVTIITTGITSGVSTEVTKAAGGVTVEDGNNKSSISYNTTFAWAPGTYYVKLTDGKADIATSAADAASGATVAGSDDQYAKLVVKIVTSGEGEDKKETYHIEVVGGKYYTAAASTGTMTVGNDITYSNLNLTLDAAIKYFDADSKGYGKINGVTAGDTLTSVNAGTIITTAELKANDKVTIDTTTFKAGAAGVITFTGAKVTSGAILLDAEGAVVTESDATADTVQTVKLTSVDDKNAGVVVTFDKGEITSIKGLDDGDQIVVTGKDSEVTYGYMTVDGTRYLAKSEKGTVTYAAVPTDTAKTDVLSMEFAKTTSVKVGTFAPTTANTADVPAYYVDAGTSATGDVTLAASTTAKDAENGHYYAKVVIGDTDGTISSISVVKGNSSKLVDTATDFTGTITVPAGLFKDSVVKYKGTPDTGYKVAFTGVGAGSTFTNLDSDDTIVTGELAAGKSITVGAGTYTAVGTEAQTFKFSGNKMTQGTVTLAAGNTLTAADGTTISYTAGTDPNNNEVTLVFGENGLASLTGLTKDETVTLLAADGTETVYKATNDNGSAVTREVTTKDGKKVTDKLTIPVDETTGRTNILDVTKGTEAVLHSQFTWTNGSIGYFQAKDPSASAGDRAFTVESQGADKPVTLTEGMVVIQAKAVYANGKDDTDGYQLILTPKYADAAGNLKETEIPGDTITVTAPTPANRIVYDQAGAAYKVAFTGVANGSSITVNKEGSTIQTAALAVDDSITVNGQLITNKADSAQMEFYVAGAKDVRVINGTIAVTDIRKGELNDNTLGDTVAYTPGEDADDGVVVAYGDGLVTSIKGLNKGESVAVTNNKNVVTTYTAALKDPSNNNIVIWKTVTGDTDDKKNGTSVISIVDGAEVPTTGYADVADLKSENGFSTKYDAEKSAMATGYFMVDDKGAVTIADVAKGTTIATYKNAGAALIKAVIASDGTLTLTKEMVGITGAAATAAAGVANVTTATLNITGGQTIKYAKTDLVGNITITGAGKGSEFTDITDGDSIETISLSAGDTVKVGTTTYTAGGTGKLAFTGTAVKSGIFNVGTAGLEATNFVDSTKVQTKSGIAYVAGTATGTVSNGVNVTVSNGLVTGISGLWLGEQVTYTQTVTAKDGSQTSKVITYQAADTAVASGAQKGSVVVTKTETVDGKVTTYKQTFASDSLDVTKTTGWATDSASTTTYFQFGDTSNADYTTTGYFKAKENTTPEDANKGKYSATIEAQSKTTLSGEEADYYLKVTATKGTAGNVTFTEMTLVHLESTGAWKEVANKELYSVALTAPKGANIKLADHEFAVAITADGTDNSTFSNVGNNDTVTATELAKDKYIVVNNAKYTSAYDTSGAIEVVGNTIKSGTVKVEAGNSLTANADGAKIAYAAAEGATSGVAGADGVVVVFDAAGGITSIADLETGEKVTITAQDGTVTTYERTKDTTDPNNKSVITKTITKGDQKTVWKTDPAATNVDKDIVKESYGVSSDFSWPVDSAKDSVGYFKVDTNAATIKESSGEASIKVTSDTAEVIRAVVQKTDNGYTITSLQVLKGQDLKDNTGVVRKETETPTTPVAITINAPGEAGITFALDKDAIVLPTPSTDTEVVDRNVQLNITGAKAGQKFTGLAAEDTVSTGNLDAGDEITVGDYVFAAAATGTLKVNAAGQALNGGFKLGATYTVTAKRNTNDVVVTMSSGDAMAVVVNGNLQSIYKLGDQETVTVKETDANGVVSTVTYTGEAEGGKIIIKRKTETDGVITYATADGGEGVDILSSSVEYTTTGSDNGVVSKFNWTQKSGSGYFQLTDKDGKLKADTLSVATQTKEVKIGKANVGEIYAKVSLDADNTLSGITLWQVQEDGTLASVTALSDSQKVNVVITAPAGKLTAKLTDDAFKSADTIQINGVAAESKITLGAGDSMNTVALTAKSEKVTVNGTPYQAGGNTVLKFTHDGTNPVLQDGIVKLDPTTGTAGFYAAGADSAVAADNIKVTFAGEAATTTTPAEEAVITVVNGVVTNISGKGAVTVGNAVYKHNGTCYDLEVTLATGETFTTANLAKDASIKVGGKTYASGAADNSITLKEEGGTAKLYSGVVKLISDSIALTDGDATVGTDDITVSGKATIKVHNGTIQSITGLAAGETLTVVDNSVDKIQVTTTYTASATSVTRKVETVDNTGEETKKTTVETTATLLAGGDVFTANYYSAAGDTDTALVGQFSWKEINGRAIGYFAVTEDKKDTNTIKAAVGEQATEVIVKPPKSGSKKYLVASAQNKELTLGDVLSIDSAGKVTTTAINSATLGSDSLFTITAPSDAIKFAKPATNVKVAIKNLAADSEVSGLIKGDTVTTAVLNAKDSVLIGGITYKAAAKGALTFIGEGNVVASEGTVSAGTAAADISGAALLSGTVLLVNGNSAKLAGGSAKTETGVSDDITVTTTSYSNVAVKVANGVVTSITGLKAQGDTVTVTNASGKIGSGKNAVEYSGATIVYTCIDTEGKMFKRTISTTGETPTVLDESFLTAAKAGGEIASGAYKAAVWTDIGGLNFSATGSAKTTFAYYKLDEALTTDTTDTWAKVPADSTTLVTKANAKDWGDSATDTQFVAEPDESYLKVTAKTTKDGVTTISSVDIYNSGATGALTKNAKQISAYEGTLTIDGTSGMTGTTYDTKYAVINYTLTKNGTFDVVANNVSYKSKFVNLGEGDMVTTAQITADDNVKLESGTYNIYHAVKPTDGKGYTEARSITVKSKKGDGVSITTKENGTIDTLTDLFTKGESVTITEQTAAGVATTVYAATADGVITRTVTSVDGTKTIATTKAAVTATTNILALPEGNDWVTVVDNNTVVSDFDWTLRKNTTGYFKVAKGAATAKVQKTTITGKDTSSYIAVAVSDHGTVASIEQMRFDKEKGLMVKTTEASAADTFSGKLNITAPTANEFKFDRTALGESINAESTTLNITGIIADSAVSSLVNNDTVTTAKLKKETSVSVNSVNSVDTEVYTVGGNGGALSFKVQDVNINGETSEGRVTLTSGTVALGYWNADDNDAGKGYVYVGKDNCIEVAQGDDITVTASTNKKGVSTFTIGDLAENESFKFNGVTYQKSGTNLIRTYNDAEGATVNEIYAIKGAKSVTSANLTKASNWKPVAETLQTDETTNAMTSKYGVVTANLALADTRFTADRKAANRAKVSYDNNYDYVLDKYVNSATKASTKALNGYVVENDAADWQSAVGQAKMSVIVDTIANTTTYSYQYLAESAIGQAIKVAANWQVAGSDFADTITGAAKGTDFIRGGQGNDTITLGGAADKVVFNLNADGQNVVTGYASGKDEIVLDDFDSTADDIDTVGLTGTKDGNFSVHLGNNKADSGNVYIYKDANGDGLYNAVTTDEAAAENSVMLKGMGNGKAVTINDRHFYFGNGYTSTKGATFAYEDGAYYVGNTSKKNGLKVTTDKTKYSAKTLGEDVVIDLMAKDSEGHSYYTNINTVDASASANRVVLSASSEAGAEITLKGGTYQSTLKSGVSNDTLQGGSGQDMFWFDDLSGSDTVKSYTAGKDSVYIGGKADLTEAGYKVSASGKDVVISKGDSQVKIAGAVNAAKAVTVSTDGKIGGESVSYFVGKSGAKVSNTFTYVDGAYYVGNSDTKDASAKVLDTLKVTGTLKTAPTAKTEINLNETNKYQSIEAVDASTLKAAKTVTDTSTMGVVVTANNDNGTLFKASNYSDTFICDADDGKGTNVLQGFSVGDIIQINGLDEAQTKAVAAQINSLTKGAGNVTVGDMTLTFKGTKGTATVVTDTTDPTVHKIVMK